MSDTLPEREDEIPASAHRVNSSGNCSISGCPCRGWSAQEAASVKEVSNQPLTARESYERDLGRRDPDLTPEMLEIFEEADVLDHAHESAARGGGDEWRVAQRFDGVVLIVRAESDNRETPLLTLSKSDDDYVMADRIVTEHNSYQSLMAEREQLRKVVHAAVHVVRSYRYGNSSPDLADEFVASAAKVLNDTMPVNEQRSTSE